MSERPIIGITMGDAAGVGPEIIVKALNHKEVYEFCRPVVIGDLKMLKRAQEIVKTNLKFNEITEIEDSAFEYGVLDCVNIDLLPYDLPFGEISSEAGHAAFKFIEKAVELAKESKIQVICTAPLNKAALHLGGHMYPGHTEILADLTGTKDYSMLLTTPKLKVIHLTTHMGLIDAIKSINVDRTYKVIKLAYDTLKSAGYKDPKIAVAGINPHCGENGMFGYGEEEEKLIPAIEKGKSEGINVSGPYPSDTVFFRAIRGEFDIVIACYHDQGHVPVKVSGFEDGVNITVGLNGGIIRTSVDHGTAFDIAGKNIADETSLIAALKSGAELAPKNK